MTQRRQTKTEAKIRAALAKIIREQGVDGVTASAVAREAGINRGTFYAHYTDKLDLLAKQVDAIMDDFSRILLKAESEEVGADDLIPRANVLEALRYAQDNYDFISALTDGGRDVRLQERLKDVLGQLLEREAARYPQLTLSYRGIPHDYGREMLLSGVTSIIWLWVRKGCVESPEEICDIIYMNKDLRPSELLT